MKKLRSRIPNIILIYKFSLVKTIDIDAGCTHEASTDIESALSVSY